MKEFLKSNLFVLLSSVAVVVMFCGGLISLSNKIEPKEAECVKSIPMQQKYDTIKVKVTGFHATKKECGKDSTTCSNGYKITEDSYTDVMGTCGATHDLFRRYLNEGDTIQLITDSLCFSQYYIVRTSTNNTLRNRIDILLPKWLDYYDSNGLMVIKRRK
jgi:hypothetical protein